MNQAAFYRKANTLEDLMDITEQEARALAMERLEGADERVIEDYAKIIAYKSPLVPYVITKTVEVTETEYDQLANNLIMENKIIQENQDFMYSRKETYYCLAIKCKSREWTILVESEGYGYARYAAKIKGE